MISGQYFTNEAQVRYHDLWSYHFGSSRQTPHQVLTQLNKRYQFSFKKPISFRQIRVTGTTQQRLASDMINPEKGELNCTDFAFLMVVAQMQGYLQDVYGMSLLTYTINNTPSPRLHTAVQYFSDTNIQRFPQTIELISINKTPRITQNPGSDSADRRTRVGHLDQSQFDYVTGNAHTAIASVDNHIAYYLQTLVPQV